jgi:hypothetical protein
VAALIGSAILISLRLAGAPFAPLLLPGGIVAACAVVVLLASRPPALSSSYVTTLPALAVVAILCALQCGGQLLDLSATGAPDSASVNWNDVRDIRNVSNNAIRLLDLLSPAAVENLGIRSAYEQRTAMAEMRSYGATRDGASWLHIPSPDALRQTHVDDNVIAVHILGPFGRIGGLGVAFVLLATVTAVYSLKGPMVLRSQLAVTIFAVTSLYMVLANVGWVPFTGRNFYFLAIASHSDLLEGGLLMLIAISGLDQRVASQ